MQRKTTLTFCRASRGADCLQIFRDDSSKRTVNDVVRAIDKDVKWIEEEYYHWLGEEYHTGWVLKVFGASSVKLSN